jgi:1-acyl-sn-glycerol-3-phosphate acyltransferase
MKKRMPLKRWLLWVVWSPILLIAWLLGWRARGDLYDVPKCVAVGAPHTSNWDFILFLWLACYFCRLPRWMVKSEMDKPIIGSLARLIGAMFIKRDAAHNVVEQVIEEFRQHDKLIVVVAPEGTRKRTEYWKSGFYYIALRAKVPLALAVVDYKNKVVDVSRIYMLTGNIDSDMDVLRETFAKGYGKFPHQASPIRLREETKNTKATI